MDFKQIEAFINVAKYKSFSKAADAIYLSQPTVSAHIISLEQELNMALFDRNGKEIRLTYAGSTFLDYAINMVNTRNTAVSTLSTFGDKVDGKLFIASSTTPCRFMLPLKVKSFYNIYPNISFNIKEESTKKVIDLILSCDADIGIVGEIIPDPKLTYYKIDDDHLILISKDKTLPNVLKIEDIYKQSFILREKGSATRNVFENSLRSSGFMPEKLKVFAEVNNLENVIQFVKNGIGVSIVSELACSDLIQNNTIFKHTIEGLNLTRGIYLVKHVKRTLSPLAKAFLNHIITDCTL